MDDQTALILALQLIALCCIAAALLLYLLCRIRNRCDRDDSDVALNLGLGRAVLLTSCDTAFGLQCALHLSKLGFRVFAGLREDDESGSLAAKILRAKLKEREMLASEEGAAVTTGPLITLPLDVTREDMLHEAVVQIRRHLPAGEDGLWAVINTAGICCKGRLENQENAHWDAMLKYNVVGSLRTARAFFSLLRNKRGRLINIGANEIQNSGLVAYTASRYAVEGASVALRNELTQYGIHVITLQPNGTAADKVFAHPKIGAQNKDKTDVHTVLEIQHSPNKYLDYNPTVLPLSAMRVLEEALLTKSPKESYKLLPERKFWSLRRNVTAVQNKIVATQRKNSQSAKT